MFRKMLFASLALLVLPAASAWAGVVVGVGYGGPSYYGGYYRPYYRGYYGGYYGPYYYRPPVIVAPAPVYVAPPVYVQPVPTPVYVQPAPSMSSYGLPAMPPPPPPLGP